MVNWWGSWPASPLRGWNVSERYYYKLMSDEKPQNETFPTELFQRYASVTPKKVSGPEMDRFYAGIFHQQLKRDSVRVAALYLPGLDILNYEFFESKKIDPFTYTDLYRKHLEWLDQAVQEIHRSGQDHHLLIIFHQGRSLTEGHTMALIHGKERMRLNPAAVSVSETAVAPLLLYSCGLPVSKAMDSNLISLAVPPSRLSAAPLRVVPAYVKEATAFESAHVGEFNDLLIEQMKSLGYLQ